MACCCCCCCDVVMVGGTAGGWEVATGRSWKALPAGKSSNPSKSTNGKSRSAGVITPEAIPLWGVL